MKYYKLLKNIESNIGCYPVGIIGKIYPGDDNFGSVGSNCSYFYENYPGMFQKATPGDYYVQEGVMPEYFAIKRVADNPLWQKYIDWLNKTYSINYSGDLNNFYGFDCSVICLPELTLFRILPVELTLEQWNSIINKTMEEEFKLPEKWCVKVTDDNRTIINNWKIKQLYANSLTNASYWKYVRFDGSGSEEQSKDCIEITYSQFVKHVLNQEVMEENKEMVGYKLKDLTYKNAVLAITQLGYPERTNILKLDGYSHSISKLQKAGVLDLWFEPCYKDKTPDITINGYKGEFFDNYVKFGCAEIDKRLFINMHSTITKRKEAFIGNKWIEGFIIGKGTFTKEQIKEIANYYTNKK